jgi:hypothetical protein
MGKQSWGILGAFFIGMVRIRHRIALKTVRMYPHYAVQGERDFTG